MFSFEFQWNHATCYRRSLFEYFHIHFESRSMLDEVWYHEGCYYFLQEHKQKESVYSNSREFEKAKIACIEKYLNPHRAQKYTPSRYILLIKYSIRLAQ